MAGDTHGEHEKELWLERIIQLLHDPLGKVKYLARHKRLSQELAETITGLNWTEEEWKQALVNRPDAIMAGADRPCLTWATRQHFNTVTRQRVTHPLSRSDEVPPLLLADSTAQPPVGKASGVEEREQQREAARRLVTTELATGGDYEGAFYRVWRRFRDELVALGSKAGELDDEIEGVARELFWSAIPADMRCPDASIWDHTRASAALSFMNVVTSTKKKSTELRREREPWLVQVSLSGVQTFVNTARTTRDLWVGSFLFADLAFHAMLPFIEAYGPTAILYPDLRANPRMDAWLAGVDETEDGWSRRQAWGALPENTEVTSFAALVPNSFVAVVPQGGADGMPELRELANRSRERVRRRWKRHSDDVERWFLGSVKPSDNHWRAIWERQQTSGDLVYVRWTAVPWVHNPKMGSFVQSGALPLQDRAKLPSESTEDNQRREERMKRLGRWVPEEHWAHNERTRYAFGRVNANLLQMERGFDYAATNAQLRAVHQLRKQAASWSTLATGESGVKCSLCAQRSALTTNSGKSTHIDSLTVQARAFWKAKELDPEQQGGERLCAVCSTKRFLVTAGGAHRGINSLWANDGDRLAITSEGEARVPFPSTTAIAAQGYVAALLRANDPDVRTALETVVRTHRALGWPRTQFPRCLRQLKELHDEIPSGDVRREFLMREPQELLFPEAMEARVCTLPARQQSHGRAHVDAIRRLLSVSEDRLKLDEPSSRLAVIKVDGDSLGSLLTGTPGRLHARWRDVLHPEVVDKLSSGEGPEAAEWKSLLDSERLMGPSLHAFVTRALGEFSHRLAPWVVEQEFDGRLIYAGGDDLLALAPAHQALPIAARLQQLFSAAWVVDTEAERDAWAWRRSEPANRRGRSEARGRFVIPVAAPGEPLQLPATRAERHAGYWTGHDFEPVDVPKRRGPVIPMLGRGQSLSAGIVYAHFKDRLGALVGDAQQLVDEAKRRPEKRAVALAWRSRGGEKLRCMLPWDASTTLGDQKQSRDGRYESVRAWSRLAEAFSNGTLSKDLPYRLRDRGSMGATLCDRFRDAPPKLLQALGRLAGDGLSADLKRDVVTLWLAGLLLHDEKPERAAAGLTIARSLSAEFPNLEVDA